MVTPMIRVPRSIMPFMCAAFIALSACSRAKNVAVVLPESEFISEVSNHTFSSTWFEYRGRIDGLEVVDLYSAGQTSLPPSYTRTIATESTPSVERQIEGWLNWQRRNRPQ